METTYPRKKITGGSEWPAMAGTCTFMKREEPFVVIIGPVEVFDISDISFHFKM